MTLGEFKTHLYRTLKNSYDPEEVAGFHRLLGEAYLRMSRPEMLLNSDREIPVEVEALLVKALDRLQKHEPIQYILGETEFYGLPFKVSKNVLIPRPETEELVEWILEDLALDEAQKPQILDIGTGSGCIAISLAKNLLRAKVTAFDISEPALQTAKENAVLNSVNLSLQQVDILGLRELSEIFDVIVSNPPYVRELEKQEMKPNVLENEPETALFVKDENPLLFYEKITKLARLGLKDNGLLFFEINQYLAEETEQLLQKAGFETCLRKDFRGNYRMLRGRKL